MEYLYHYTTIESLLYILKNKTIRFNSLLFVDDSQEVQTLETSGLGKYCFASAWTDKKESLSFWSMYTNNMTGVMIKMIKNPFLTRKQKLNYYDEKVTETFVPKEILKSNYLIPTIEPLRKIKYTDDSLKLKPKTIDDLKQNEKGEFDIEGNLNEIGIYKPKCWKFQSEWRYSFIVLPFDKNFRLKINVDAKSDGLPFSHYDIAITDNALKTLEVICGPRMSEAKYIIVKDMIEKYAPFVKLSKSEIKIK